MVLLEGLFKIFWYSMIYPFKHRSVLLEFKDGSILVGICTEEWKAKFINQGSKP